MLYANLFFAVILLITANSVILIRGKGLVGTTFVLSVICSLLPFGLMLIGVGVLLYILWEFAAGYLSCTFPDLELVGLPCEPISELLAFHARRPSSAVSFSLVYRPRSSGRGRSGN